MGSLAASNYQFTYVNGTLTVNKASLAVTADSFGRLYGDANPTLTYGLAGFKNGETLATSGVTGSPSVSTTATAASAVGPYTITAAGGSLAASNYQFTYVNGTLTVNKAGLAVTADSYGRLYGDANPTLTYGLAGFKNGETLATSGVTGSPSVTTTATAASAVGPYTITAAAGSLAASNYQFTYVNGTLTVNKASLAVTADSFGRLYGDANPTLTYGLAGFKNGETLATSGVTGSPSLTTLATAASAVGPYTITAAAGSLAASNYQFTYVNGTLTVNKATLTVKADNIARAFGDPNPTLTATYGGFKNGETLPTSGVTGTPDLSTTATVSSSVGNYPITAAAGSLAATNYQFNFADGTLTVLPVTTVTIWPAKDNTLIEDTTGSLSNAQGDIYVGRVAGTGNFKLRRGLVGFDLVSQVPAGATIQSVTLTMYATSVRAGGAVGLHRVAANWGEGTSSAGGGSGVPATPGDATWLHTFYNTASWTNSGGDFAAPVSASQTISASGAFYTWNSTSQLVADVQSWLDSPTTNFGWLLRGDESQPTTASAKSFASREAADTAQRPVLTVTYAAPAKANSTIIVTSAAGTSTYGDSVTYTASVAAAAPGTDTPTGSVTFYDGLTPIGTRAVDVTGGAALTTTTLGAGSHSITASYGGDQNFSTSISTPAVDWTVNQATLTVRADDASRTYGEANPTFTATISGYKNGETLPTSGVTGSPSLECAATAASPAGSYTIAVGPGTLAAQNYAFNFVDGMLSVLASNGRIDMTLTATPVTSHDPSTGEIDVLPQNLAWLDEWGSFFVDLWLSQPGGGGAGVAGGSLTLTYDTNYFSVSAGDVSYGPAFDVGRTTDVNDPVGRVTLSASTLATNIGDDRPALFARVRFAPTSSDSGVPGNSQGQYILPVTDLGFGIENSAVDLVGLVAGTPEVGPVPQTELWPVMYDIDDDGNISFSDFAYFSSAFQYQVGNPGAAYAYAADFDCSGIVTFSDFSYFSANFQRRASGSTSLAYPANFPAAWPPAGNPLRLDLSDTQRRRSRQTADEHAAAAGTLVNPATQYEAASPLSEAQLAPVIQTAIARIEGIGTAYVGLSSLAAPMDSNPFGIQTSETAAAAEILSHVALQIVDLPGSLLGREVGGTLIQIDIDAAGYGWFVDTTPWDDVEFAPAVPGNHDLASRLGNPAQDRVDLLTVILHELGHLLGRDHEAEGLMDDTLPLGTRRLPDESLGDLAQSLFAELEDTDPSWGQNSIDRDTIDSVFADSHLRRLIQTARS